MSTTLQKAETDPVASALVATEATTRAAHDATIQAALDALAAAGATDSELAAAVATLNTALGTKQDASTAATDDELASAVSAINSSLAGKQDASSAATDSELAAAISTVNSAVALKQDAATAATDAELASAVSGEVTARNSAITTAVAAEAVSRANADALKLDASQKGAASGVPASDTNNLLAAVHRPNQYGTLANRPSAATAGDRATYFATDDNGGTLYQAQSGAWVLIAPRGILLGQAIRTTDTGAISNTAYADVSGMSITFTPRSTGFMVECWIADLVAAGTFAGGGSVNVYTRLVDATAATDYTGDVYWTGGGSFFASGAKVLRRYFAPGDFTANTSMTVKLQTKMGSSGVTSPIYALNARMGIRAVEDS